MGMSKNKEQDEMSKELLKWLEEEDPFGLNEEIKTILFKCKACLKEDEVPDFVVHEFQFDLKEHEKVEIECPFCGGTMRRARKSPK
jgi:redox-regulated HSP33 family molecular chaperone